MDEAIFRLNGLNTAFVTRSHEHKYFATLFWKTEIFCWCFFQNFTVSFGWLVGWLFGSTFEAVKKGKGKGFP